MTCIYIHYTAKVVMANLFFGRSTPLRTKNGFPNVIGAADCMHIAVKAPIDTEDA